MALSHDPQERRDLIERAHRFCRARKNAEGKELLRLLHEEMETEHQDKLKRLDDGRTRGELSQEDYIRRVSAELEDRDLGLQMAKPFIDHRMAKELLRDHLEIAETVADSSRTSSQMIVAGLFLNLVRSQEDIEEIQVKFGAGIAGVLADILNLAHEPGDFDKALGRATSDVKTLYLAGQISYLRGRTTEIAEKNPKSLLSDNAALQMYKTFTQVRSNDIKLDLRFATAFNDLCQAAKFPHKLHVAPDGSVSLKQNDNNASGPPFRLSQG
jgi:hypothetical protein